MKIINFFQFLWVIFALLDPDPDPQGAQSCLGFMEGAWEDAVCYLL
jgi:hypothetical protein